MKDIYDNKRPRLARRGRCLRGMDILHVYIGDHPNPRAAALLVWVVKVIRLPPVFIKRKPANYSRLCLLSPRRERRCLAA